MVRTRWSWSTNSFPMGCFRNWLPGVRTSTTDVLACNSWTKGISEEEEEEEGATSLLPPCVELQTAVETPAPSRNPEPSPTVKGALATNAEGPKAPAPAAEVEQWARGGRWPPTRCEKAARREDCMFMEWHSASINDPAQSRVHDHMFE